MFAIQHQPTRGACFHDAFLIGVELLDYLDPELFSVVHGVATGTGGAALGWRYAHAWLGLELGGLALVIDHLRPNEPCPRELYYRAGQIDPAECRRYSMAAAAGHALRTGHSGPWESLPDAALVGQDQRTTQHQPAARRRRATRKEASHARQRTV